MNSSTDIVGARVLTKPRPHRIVSCGYHFNRWLGTESGSTDCHKVKDCDWVAGCSMMFRRHWNSGNGQDDAGEKQRLAPPVRFDPPRRGETGSARLINESPVFDEKFSFFGEDADFCLRAKKAGYRVVSLPNAVVYHGKAGASPTPLSDKMYLDYYKAKFRLIKKYCNLPQQIISLCLHLTVFSLGRYVSGRRENVLLKIRALSEISHL